MDKITVIKFAAKAATSLGTSKIVSSIIKTHVPDLGPVSTITVPVASFMIGSMAADVMAKYAEEKVDRYAAILNSTKTKVEEAKNKQETV